MLDRQTVVGGSGTKLAVRTAGPSDGQPVILVHGWAQSGRIWSAQLAGSLARQLRLIAVDLRGHGDSDVPADGYDSAENWARDVRALLELAGRPAIVVGWSYGGLVLADYLRTYGTTGLAGLVLVGAITEIGRGHPGGHVGPAMRAALPDALSEDDAVAEAALRSFVTGMANGRPTELATGLLAESLRVPAFVRAALFRRDVASAEVLSEVDVPTLVLHGRADAVVDPGAAEFAAATVPGARLRWFERTGHLPFLERRREFDEELLAFTELATTEET